MNVEATSYWEQRAIRYGHVERGLPAICSYGMPRLYNEAIHLSQIAAMAPWLRSLNDVDVLDVGCGVGRWSLALAERGNRVHGVDISPRMVQLARQRADERRLACSFSVADLASLELPRRFDAILSVTVLQHIVSMDALSESIRNLVAHLRPGGRLFLLEATPDGGESRCDSQTFRARAPRTYEELLASAGCEIVKIEGVDIAPLRPLMFSLMRKLPAGAGRMLAAATACLSLPLDIVVSRHFPSACWHKVIVASRAKA